MAMYRFCQLFLHYVLFHADKVSPPKFDILEFFFYKKKNLYQKTYLNFRIINDENLSEIYPYFSQTAFLCIHNCNSLRKGVERSLASHVQLKDQKRVKEWKLVQITRNGVTMYIHH